MRIINVKIDSGFGIKRIFTIDAPVTISDIWTRFESELFLPKDEFYAVYNGRLAHDDDICTDGYVSIVPRLCGGKGGFGSMLRAIGAQIEKTTNREACRDLSGRRLRDINEEKRLKVWIEKQSKREEEAAERKKRKLEKLRAEPKHEFKDQIYERERSVLTERVGDAVEEGFKLAKTGCSGVKRKSEEENRSNKRKTLLDMDIDSDELDTSDDSEDEEEPCKKLKGDPQVSDSGHCTDESDTTSKTILNAECKEVVSN